MTSSFRPRRAELDRAGYPPRIPRLFAPLSTDDSIARLADLVMRDFTAMRFNQLWVGDLTYVAFVIDAFARRIVGWRA
jgi:transposase InsO family protein